MAIRNSRAIGIEEQRDVEESPRLTKHMRARRPRYGGLTSPGRNDGRSVGNARPPEQTEPSNRSIGVGAVEKTVRHLVYSRKPGVAGVNCARKRWLLCRMRNPVAGGSPSTWWPTTTTCIVHRTQKR